MPIVAAKCPNCGGELQLDDNLKSGFCMYCGSRVIVQEAIELKKVQVEGKVSVEGLATVENLLTRGNQCLEAGSFKQAEKYFDQAIDIDPKNPAAWHGKFNAQYQVYMGEKADSFHIYNEVMPEDIEPQRRAEIAKGLGIHWSIFGECLRQPGVLFKSIPDSCFALGRKAIEYAGQQEKTSYQNEYDEKLQSYQNVKANSEKTIIDYFKNRKRPSAAVNIFCLLSALGLVALGIYFVSSHDGLVALISFFGGLCFGLVSLATWPK